MLTFNREFNNIYREMQDVFKELKVLGRKGKSCAAKINKDVLETKQHLHEQLHLIALLFTLF